MLLGKVVYLFEVKFSFTQRVGGSSRPYCTNLLGGPYKTLFDQFIGLTISPTMDNGLWLSLFPKAVLQQIFWVMVEC